MDDETYFIILSSEYNINNKHPIIQNNMNIEKMKRSL